MPQVQPSIATFLKKVDPLVDAAPVAPRPPPPPPDIPAASATVASSSSSPSSLPVRRDREEADNNTSNTTAVTKAVEKKTRKNKKSDDDNTKPQKGTSSSGAGVEDSQLRKNPNKTLEGVVLYPPELPLSNKNKNSKQQKQNDGSDNNNNNNNDLFARALRIWVTISSFCSAIRVSQMPFSFFLKQVIDEPESNAQIRGDATEARDIIRGLVEGIMSRSKPALASLAKKCDAYSNPSGAHVWLAEVCDMMDGFVRRKARTRRVERIRTQSFAGSGGGGGGGGSSPAGDKKTKTEEELEEEEDDAVPVVADASSESNNNTNQQPPEEVWLDKFLHMLEAIDETPQPVRWHKIAVATRVQFLEELVALFLESSVADSAGSAIATEMRQGEEDLKREIANAHSTFASTAAALKAELQKSCAVNISKQPGENDGEKEGQTITSSAPSSPTTTVAASLPPSSSSPEKALVDSAANLAEKRRSAADRRDKAIASARYRFYSKFFVNAETGARAVLLGKDRFRRYYWMFPMETKIFVETVDGETDMKFVQLSSSSDKKRNKLQGGDHDDAREQQKTDRAIAEEGKEVQAQKEEEEDPLDKFSFTAWGMIPKPVGAALFNSSHQRSRNQPQQQAAAAAPDDDDDEDLETLLAVTTTTSDEQQQHQQSEKLSDDATAAAMKRNTAAFGFVPFHNVEQLIEQLDDRGVRERALIAGLEAAKPYMAAIAAQHQSGRRFKYTNVHARVVSLRY